MKRIFRWLPSRRWLWIPPILIGICVFSWMKSNQTPLPLPDLDATQTQPTVEVFQVDLDYFEPSATGFGTARPSRIWTAIAEVKGNIIEVHPQLESGETIREGEILLKIDPSDYQLRIQQREAELQSAEAQLEELKASQKADQESKEIENGILVVIDEEFRRLKNLRNRGASDSEVDIARANKLRQDQAVKRLENSLSLYPSKIKAADANIKMVKTQLAEAKRDLDRTTITCPFNGVLTGVDLEPFQFVNQGQQLFQLQDDKTMEVAAQFSLHQLDHLAPSLREMPGESTVVPDSELLKRFSAEVVVRSGSFETSWNGVPVRIADSIDQRTRTLGVVVQVSNPNRHNTEMLVKNQTPSSTNFDGTAVDWKDVESSSPLTTPLRSGSYCEVRLVGSQIANTMLIPRTALDGDSVYVVGSNSRLSKRRVTVAFSADEQVVISSGLKVGELVAIRPPVPAVDDMLVNAELRTNIETTASNQDDSNEETSR